MLERADYPNPEEEALGPAPTGARFRLGADGCIDECDLEAAMLLGLGTERRGPLSSCASLGSDASLALQRRAAKLFESGDAEPSYLRLELSAGEGSLPFLFTLRARSREKIHCRIEPVGGSGVVRQPSAGFGKSGVVVWSMETEDPRFRLIRSQEGSGPQDRDEWEVSLADWAQRVSEGDRDRFEGSFNSFLAGSNPSFHARYRAIAPGGESKWISTIARRRSGEDAQIVGLHRDESEIPNVEDDLRLFSYLAKKIHIPILVTDPAGFITWTNQAFTDTTGYPLEEALGRRPGGLLQGPLTDPTAVRHMRDRLRRGKSFHVEVINYKKNGVPYWARVDANPLVNERGEVTRYIAFQTDISEAKKSQNAILLNEIKYISLFDNSIDALLLLSERDGTVIEANRAAMHFFDTPRLVGRRLEDLCPSDGFFKLARMLDMLDGPEPSRHVSGEFETPEGRRCPVEMTVSQAHIGDSMAIFITLRDISEKRLLEEQLRHAQRMEAVGRLAGGIAHDFNNLLAGLRGFSELLCNSRDLTKRDHVYSQEILKITDRATKLTSRLLSFSRGKSDRPVVASLNAIVGNLTPMLSRILKTDIHFSSRLSPKIGNVKVDLSQIEQVVMNLVVNAQEAIVGPEGVIVVETRQARLDGSEILITGKPEPGEYASVSVSDNGQGIPPGVVEKIFEPFFTTKKGAGTGLGLSIVYGIIQNNGGHLQVESEPGAGTIFTFYFPVVEEEVPTEEAREPAPEMPEPIQAGAGSPTILIAEDQEQVRDILELGLGQAGYNLIVAVDGREAIELAEKHHGSIDLLLTDSIMPKVHGAEAALRIRQLHPEAKVILMSGLPLSESGQDALPPGVDAYVDKPFSIRKLLELIDSLLRVRN